jgi:predicted patatin/cPLA2 family phospholipase
VQERMYQGALILEGGGFRGVYTAGVLDFLMDRKVFFSSVYGISAGACNALNYLSQDRGRYVEIALRFCNDPRYMGVKQLLRTGSIFNWQFSFYEIPERYLPFDYDTFYASPMELKVGATDCKSGSCRWFSNRAGDDTIACSIASSSMPLLSKMQKIDGRNYLDGGIADSIPVAQAQADGWDKQLIVLTQNEGYVKQPNRLMPMIRCAYRDYPELCRAMEHRHETYNQSLEQARQLEQQGKAVIIQPSRPMVLKRIEKDTAKLQAAYENGYEDAAAAWERVKQLFCTE